MIRCAAAMVLGIMSGYAVASLLDIEVPDGAHKFVISIQTVLIIVVCIAVLVR